MSHEAPCLNDWPGMSHEARVVCEGFSSRVGAPPDALVTWKHLGIDRLTPNRASCTDKTTDVRSCRNGVVVVKEHAFGRGPHQKPGARCPTDARSCRVGVGGETRYTAIPPREDTSFWRVEDATSRATTESARSSTAGAAYAAEGNLVLPEWNYPIIWLRRRMYRTQGKEHQAGLLVAQVGGAILRPINDMVSGSSCLMRYVLSKWKCCIGCLCRISDVATAISCLIQYAAGVVVVCALVVGSRQCAHGDESKRTRPSYSGMRGRRT